MKYLAFLTFIGLLFIGCKEDKPDDIEYTKINLDFYASYDDSPLVMLQDYDYAFGHSINFAVSDFYIDNVKLVDTDGNKTSLFDVALVDFDDHNVDAASAQSAIRIIPDQDVAKTKYVAIEMGIGLDPAKNATVPEDYLPENPLSLGGRYWRAWDSYIFAKFQGNITAGDVSKPYLFHTGKDEVYRSFTLPIDLDLNEHKTIEFDLDHKAIFSLDDGTYMDIFAKPTNHNPSDLEPLITIQDNFGTALNVNVK